MKKLHPFILLGMLVLASLAHGATSSEDELWHKLQTLLQSPPHQQFASKEEHDAAYLDYFNRVVQACDDFSDQYPNDKRAWDARARKLEFEVSILNSGGHPIETSQFDSLVRDIVDSSETTPAIKSKVSLLQLTVHARQLINIPDPAQLPGFEREVTAFTDTYPNETKNSQLSTLRLQVYQRNDPAKAIALLKERAEDKDMRIALDAKRQLKVIELQTHPLDLKFTALDGSDFDVTQWRGKVVVIDFWSTGNAASQAALPTLLDTYKKLHEKGMEIIGISIDSSPERLRAYIKDKEIPWPQYCDGKGFESPVTSSFGVTHIPGLWLVDRRGIIRSTESIENLERQVTSLLAE